MPSSVAEHRLRVRLDRRPYRRKPEEDGEIGGIVNRFKKEDARVDITVDELAHCIESGMSFMMGDCPNKTKNSWVSSDGFVIDIDNDDDMRQRGFADLSLDDALARCEDAGVEPVIYFESFRSGKESFGQRYKLVFVFDGRVTDIETYDRIAAGFMRLFPEVDDSCLDKEHHQSGTNKPVTVQPLARLLTPEETLERLEDYCGGSSRSGGIATQSDDARRPASALLFDGTVNEGQRHKALLSYAGRLRRNDTREDRALTLVKKYNEKRCDPPLDDGEVTALVRDVWKRYEPARMRPFEIEQGNLYKWKKDGDDFMRVLVSTTPPKLVTRLRDIDTGESKVLVAIDQADAKGGRNGESIERAVDRSRVLDTRCIVKELDPLDANISSDNARDVVQYLTKVDQVANLPVTMCVSHLGWSKGLHGPFMPYDGLSSDIRFEAANDRAILAAPFLEPRGTLDEWREFMGGQRGGNVIVRAVMGASFASPLLPFIDAQAFVLHVQGDSGSGKTAALRGAGSIWGNPGDCPGAYFRNFSDSLAALIAVAAFYRNVPLLVDELQVVAPATGKTTVNLASVQNFIYAIANGHERTTLTQQRAVRNYEHFRLLCITTGEQPINDDNAMQGALNRVLELTGEPFASRREAQRMHTFACSCYGVAGRAFVKRLQELYDEPTIAQMWQETRAAVTDRLGVSVSAQTDNIALVAFGDMMGSLLVFEPDSAVDEAMTSAVEFAARIHELTSPPEDRDTDRRAMTMLLGWILRHKTGFHDGDKSRFERYDDWHGIAERQGDHTVCFMFSEVFDELMQRHEFSTVKTLRRMAREGILHGVRANATRYRVPKRLKGTNKRAQVVPVDIDELDIFLNGQE